MESDRLTKKLANWLSFFYKYKFDFKHYIRAINKDEDGLSKNSNSNVSNNIITCWHGEINLKTMLSWHFVSFICILANGH
jgi:hypothetical protein